MVQVHCPPRPIDAAMAGLQQEFVQPYGAAISDLVATFRFAPKPIRLQLDPMARELMVEYYNEVVQERISDLRDVDSYAARYAEQACRIAVLFHAAKHGKAGGTNPIDVASVKRGIELSKWFTAEQLRILDFSRKAERGKLYKSIWDFSVRNPAGFTARDLQRRRLFAAAEDARQVLDSLVERGHLTKQSPPTGGRPSDKYILVAGD